MRHRLMRNIFLVLIIGTFLISLSACGETKDTAKVKSISNTKSNEPVSPKEAFNQEGIWFHSSDIVTKDETIYYILVFDGNGNVTHYRTSSNNVYNDNRYLTYAELRDLSEKEIIDLAKERDKMLFEEELKYEASTGETVIEAINRTLETTETQQEYEYWQERLEANKALSAKMAEAVYQEPEAHPFTLKIETDGTGNQTSVEKLVYSYSDVKPYWQNFYFHQENLTMDNVNEWTPYCEEENTIKLSPVPGNMTVYDMFFNGFDKLCLQVEEGHIGFVLDTPDTEGIKVD